MQTSIISKLLRVCVCLGEGNRPCLMTKEKQDEKVAVDQTLL